jgi:carboxypeptidase PM20D1
MPSGVNPIVTLSKAILAIEDKPFKMKYESPTSDMLHAIAPFTDAVTRTVIAADKLLAPVLVHEIAKTPAGAAMLHTTMAPTMLEGSPKENVLPTEAIARINVRIDPHDTSTSVMQHVRESVKDLPVKLEWDHPPVEPSKISSTSSRGWQIVSGLVGEMSQVPVAPSLYIGSSDSIALQSVTEDTYRFQAITNSQAGLEMIHGTNEHLTFDNLKQLADFYSRLIKSATVR